MKYVSFLIFLSFFSCTTFTPYSRFNKINSCTDNAYHCLVNNHLDLKYKTYGGFHFANNLKEYKKMKVKNKPKLKNVIVYGRSNILEGDYYLILNNAMKSNHFQFKDTIITGRKITIALNKTIDYKTNTDFLLNFSQEK